MKNRVKKTAYATVILFFAVIIAGSGAVFAGVRYAYVERAIDGDTIKLVGGEHVRYLGVDTPERGEPFYIEAKRRNSALVKKQNVKLVVCDAEPKDKYGRTLAWVYVDGAFVNAVLIKEGFGKAMIMPPCVTEKAGELRRYEEEARQARRAIWGKAGAAVPDSAVIISPEDAPRYAGRAVKVQGRVMDVHKTKSAVFLNFSRRGKKGFKAVIFKSSFEEFRLSGIDPLDYKGRNIAVHGVVKFYKGAPEIIVKLPSQISVD